MDDAGHVPVCLPPLEGWPALSMAERAQGVAVDLDRRFHAAEGRLTQGGSPLALPLAWMDWATHIANAPFQRMALGADAATKVLRFWRGVWGGEPAPSCPGDRRFADPAWNTPPYSWLRQSFLLTEAWWEKATTGLPGVNPLNERLVNFAARQALDSISPSNFPWLNPEATAATWRTGGANLAHGFQNYLGDLGSLVSGQPPEPTLKVGRDLAVTPGKVVFRNDLIELIQYAPQTNNVRPEPVLIVPAWIMKYYILDLSPQDSLIGYLVRQGYTVFCISWRNPGAEMRDIPFDAYRSQGVMAALDAVAAIRPGVSVHACGYCLGGTLLAIAAAAMARDGDGRLGDITLFCAQTDFTEAGELQLFTTEDQVAFLEDVMSAQGYLDGRQMGGAFELLRSRDLVWSRQMKTYWLGEKETPNDLMVWNQDATRMPARMHADYLRSLFLRNDLAEGRYMVGGKPVSVGDIRARFFVVGTETDHIAPWRSVYKISLLNEGEVTFVLTSGGHNAGIVSEPGHHGRSFHIARRPAGGVYSGPDEWLASAAHRRGSWWPAWVKWLGEHSGAPVAAPGTLGGPGRDPIEDAPGRYVFER